MLQEAFKMPSARFVVVRARHGRKDFTTVKANFPEEGNKSGARVGIGRWQPCQNAN